METILITGGCGFVGSNLAADLVDSYRVIAVDNFATGRQENIKLLLKHANFRLLQHDIQQPLQPGEPVQYVFHLASRASPVDYQKFPVDTLLTNAVGTYNVLSFAEHEKARVVLASTSEVYGNPRIHPQTEDYWGDVNPVGPRSCYDEGKRFAEALAVAFIREHSGFDVRIARIFNTYGPLMNVNDGRVIPNFIMQALRGESITLFGDGSQTRSFCYISDLVAGLKKMMFRNGLAGEIINLGNPREVTVGDLARQVKALTGSTSDIHVKPLPQDDPVRRRPDITKAMKLLEWEPTVSLEDGLKETIAHFRKKL